MILNKIVDFIELNNQQAIDDFLEKTQSLHDSCIQSFFMKNPMYVDKLGNMIFPKNNFPGKTDLTILFQSQFLEGCTIEFLLNGIEYLSCFGIGKKIDGIVSNVLINFDVENKINLVCNPEDKGFFEVRACTAFWKIRKDLNGSIILKLQNE